MLLEQWFEWIVCDAQVIVWNWCRTGVLFFLYENEEDLIYKMTKAYESHNVGNVAPKSTWHQQYNFSISTWLLYSLIEWEYLPHPVLWLNIHTEYEPDCSEFQNDHLRYSISRWFSGMTSVRQMYVKKMPTVSKFMQNPFSRIQLSRA